MRVLSNFITALMIFTVESGLICVSFCYFTFVSILSVLVYHFMVFDLSALCFTLEVFSMYNLFICFLWEIISFQVGSKCNRCHILKRRCNRHWHANDSQCCDYISSHCSCRMCCLVSIADSFVPKEIATCF